MKALRISMCGVALAAMLALFGCGGSGDQGSAAQEEAEPAAQEVAAEESSAVQEAAAGEGEVQEAAAEAEFAGMTIVDNESILIEVTGIDSGNLWGYTLDVYLENRTDKNLMFAIDTAAINGLVSDPFFATTVSPGAKANKEISFSSDSPEDMGIDPTDIALAWRVYDSDDWSADAIFDETVHVYPLGEEAAQRYERTPLDTDMVLFDNDSCSMVVTGFEDDAIWGYTMTVFLVNKTDTSLMFSCDDVTVNGFMCDPFWARSVMPGMASYSSISWSDSSLEENGIETVESIGFPVRVYNDDDWLAGDIVNETFTIEPW